MSFTYKRTITIDHTKVPNTDRSNFPVLVLGTYSYLATVANGGKVQNASGHDIAFFSDSALTSQLKHEVERYVATTGEVVYWVKVPTLSASVDTVIYIAYGDSGISTSQADPTNVWDSNYKAVYHLPDGSTLGLDDSTSNANTGTNHSATATSGKIDGGVAVAATYFDAADSASLSITSTSMTLEAWVKYSDGSTKYVVDKGADKWELLVTGGGAMTGAVTTNQGYVAAASPLTYNDDTWHQFVMTYGTDGNVRIYVDGAQKAVTNQTAGTISDDANPLAVGAYYNGSFAFSGSVDEVRISDVLRSADWIATEFNNQDSPSTFYAVGSEQSTSSGVTVTPTTASLTSTTFAPAIKQGVIPATLALSATKFAPVLRQALAPATKALTTATFAPLLSERLTPATKSLALSTFAPTVTSTANVWVTPSPPALTITGFAPVLKTHVIPGAASLTVSATGPTLKSQVMPGSQSLFLTTFATQLQQRTTPTTKALSLITFAPSVFKTGDVIVTPGTVSLTLTAAAPVLSLKVTPQTLALTVSMFAAHLNTVDVPRGDVTVIGASSATLNVARSDAAVSIAARDDTQRV